MKLPKELTTVTRLSIILSGICFIVFVLLAFYLGMQYQQVVALNNPMSYDTYISVLLQIFQSNATKEFLIQLISTIVAGFILYWFIERKLNDTNSRNEIKRLLKGLVGDLGYNYVGAGKVVEKEDEYLTTDSFTLFRYRTKALDAFFYEKPFQDELKFPYVKLLALIHKFENYNSISELIFTGNDPKKVLTNKSQWIQNAKVIKEDIVRLLNEIENFYKTYNIILTEYS